MARKSRKKKYQGCQECGFLARHPYCPFCGKKIHWIGCIEDKGKEGTDIDRHAPARRIEDRLVIAYFLPFMVESGQLPQEALARVTKQVLGEAAEKILDSSVWGFKFTKHPYRWKVVEADVTGEGAPYVKIRYGGWNCRRHRGYTPADVPGAVLRRDEFSCVVCGKKRDLIVVYMVPPEDEGEVTVGNLATFCKGCHEERGNMDYWSFLRSKDVPLDELIIDFRTGYVRSVVYANKIMV